MSPRMVAPNLLTWASVVEPATVEQAARTARLPIVSGHVALMPDAHVGFGSTVGSVIPTEGAVIPSAIGVDIGCGMVASKTDLKASDLPDSLDPLMSQVERAIPAGVGRGHRKPVDQNALADIGSPATSFNSGQEKTTLTQFGTLGSGNHFVEVCLDESNRVWTVLHSGSRGIGNQLASHHIKIAKGLMKEHLVSLEDPDLAYLVQDTPEFNAYIGDMLWAQRYALASRAQMNRALLNQLFRFVGYGQCLQVINCHHNFTQQEVHGGKSVWLTRKGAIKADKGDLGVIPGSMGTRTYVVRGLGNADSYHSCSHGAGRTMSRSKARQMLTPQSLIEVMGSRTWNSDRSRHLVDEHPAAYKDIDQVMADQSDLVEVVHTLRQVLNYKG